MKKEKTEQLEEESEEESDENQPKIQKRRHRKMDGGFVVEEEEQIKQFTLQINQPPSCGHIIRENYEEVKQY